MRNNCRRGWLREYDYWWLIPLVLMALACDSTEKKDEKDLGVDRIEAPVFVPTFSQDSAYHFIADQVAFGPRVPNSPAHQAAAAYLATALEGYGAKVATQSFEAPGPGNTMMQLTNVIGSFKSAQKKRILLAAHWDSRFQAEKDLVEKDQPIDGANDGASGVGVLLEIARVISDSLPAAGVDIIFFDGEDQGKDGSGWCLGSEYWARNKHQANYSAYYGILLDMVGAKNASFYRDYTSQRYAPSIVKKVWDQAHRLNHGRYFLYQDSKGAITDDHIAVNEIAKIPMIDIIDYDGSANNRFKDYHHTLADNISVIDKETLKAVGETVLHVIYQE
ncbi:MAG: M28 family peptidase [Cyclobacteriaceae bacterium]